MSSSTEPSPSTVSRAAAIAIVVVTVVGLAVATQRAVSSAAFERLTDEATFDITADASGPSESWLDLMVLLVDGRRVKWDDVKVSENWQSTERDSGSSPYLSCVRHCPAATLSFRARRFVLVLRSNEASRTFTARRNGEPIALHTVASSDDDSSVLLVEAPAAPPSMLVFVVALLLFAACAWWFAPLNPSRRAGPWLAFTVVVFHLLFWSTQSIGTEPDSPDYVTEAETIFDQGVPAYFPPGYTSMIAVMGAVAAPPQVGRWVTFLQHAMTVIAALWIYGLLRRVVNDHWALAGGLVTGLLAPGVTPAQSILSESATIFAMVGALYFAVRAAAADGVAPAVLSGVLLGWAGALRVIPLAVLFPAICVIYFASRSRALRLTLLTGAIAAAVVAMPVAWFWSHTGKFALANSSGLHLYNRVVSYQGQLDENGSATRALLSRLGGRDPRGQMKWWDIETALDLEDGEAEPILRAVALEGIRKDPTTFAAYSFRQAWDVLWTDASNTMPPWAVTEQVWPTLESVTPALVTASSVQWRLDVDRLHRSAWPWLCGLAMLGCGLGLTRPRRTLVIALALTALLYLLISACLDDLSSRHNVPLSPFLVALAVVALARVFELIGAAYGARASDHV